MMKNAADDGISLIYIPNKPKLKNKNNNKLLVENKFMPSRTDSEEIADEERIRKVLGTIKESEVNDSENANMSRTQYRTFAEKQ